MKTPSGKNVKLNIDLGKIDEPDGIFLKLDNQTVGKL